MDAAAELNRVMLNRLRWRCTRRAMLEMDLLLGQFLEQVFPQLNPEQSDAFITLADMEDLELWPFINGSALCTNAPQAQVIELLRALKFKTANDTNPIAINAPASLN
ncbi:MAG: succinate dehydrogenase assembly factor 2 [Pseudomonadota bacterium]